MKKNSPPHSGPEGSGRELESSHVGDLRPLGLDACGTVLLAASGQTGKPFFFHQHRQGVDADWPAGLREFSLDVVDGEVALAHRNGELTYPIAHRSALGAMSEVAEEAGALGRVMAELMAQDAESPRGVAEAVGDLG